MNDKKFVIPEAEILGFGNDDIITLSDGTALNAWFDEDDKEGF